MKTTKFFSEIKKVANDSTIESVFAYRVNPDKNFYEIYLHSEPTAKVKALCEKNGFSIKENILWKDENGIMVDHAIWEVMPTDANEIEYVTCDEVLKNVNENVIIASDKAMVEAGLFKCNPRKDEITLWIYNSWGGSREPKSWAPIMRVFESPLLEDIKDENGRVIEQKSTHKIDSFYGAPINGDLDLRYMLTKRDVTVEEL